ncbi:MAG: hypothetical protein J0L56_01545 [Chitinophagales bacterium]|nr:hypothetical protein [Chitinophagales bacterium]
MSQFYKLILFLVFFWLMGWAGFNACKLLNRKIREAETGWGILLYALLLVLVNMGLFFGGLWLLIKTYGLLSTGNQ